ncbi:hypothetical protein NEFER03_1397 [Nematocida sp. LUAm3]|nr:hypothetical protein NEFER03_1397 [Nematocida sp. LUAm3]KAI5174773.1 hypothetical protein NEFER02_0883 [Nematocida sp. LUAm2]KAI5177816.1 hypothetical protein NEFER01_1018 [Nematocida sp. LUAm1]
MIFGLIFKSFSLVEERETDMVYDRVVSFNFMRESRPLMVFSLICFSSMIFGYLLGLWLNDFLDLIREKYLKVRMYLRAKRSAQVEDTQSSGSKDHLDFSV